MSSDDIAYLIVTHSNSLQLIVTHRLRYLGRAFVCVVAAVRSALPCI
jgi:hypothetical protein